MEKLTLKFARIFLEIEGARSVQIAIIGSLFIAAGCFAALLIPWK